MQVVACIDLALQPRCHHTALRPLPRRTTSPYARYTPSNLKWKFHYPHPLSSLLDIRSRHYRIRSRKCQQHKRTMWATTKATSTRNTPNGWIEDWSRLPAVIWSGIVVACIVLLWYSGPHMTYDCPQVKPDNDYARYTCGPIVWSSLAAFGGCAAKLANYVWNSSPAHAFPQQLRKQRVVCDLLEPLFTMADGVAVFGGSAWVKSCFREQTNEQDPSYV